MTYFPFFPDSWIVFLLGLGLIICVRTFFTLLTIIYQYSSIDFTTYIKSTGGAELFLRLTTTASSLGKHMTTVSPTIRYKSMTSANGGNYAGQYPCDGWVDDYNLEPILSIGRIPKLVPYSIDNRWRVQTSSNMPIERSQRDLPTPPLSFRVLPPPPCFGQKRLRTLPHYKRDYVQA